MTPEALRAHLRVDFPLVGGHPDVAGLFRRPEVLGALGPALAEPYRDAGVTAVLSPEARGPVLGGALGGGLVLARKQGRNHPGADRLTSGGVGWRGSTETFQTRSFDLRPSDAVLLVDDWVTTGSSLRALTAALDEAGARCVGTSVIVDKTDADTRAELSVHALVGFDEIKGVALTDRYS